MGAKTWKKARDHFEALMAKEGKKVGPAPPKKTHVIRPGDSAAVVALLYGLPVSALRAANPQLNLNRLQPGDTLNIPRSNEVSLR